MSIKINPSGAYWRHFYSTQLKLLLPLVALLLSLLFHGVANAAVNSTAICFNNPDNYNNPTVYLWASNPANAVANSNWPGEAMSADGNYYCYDPGVAVNSINVIFSDNGNGQTADLNLNNGNNCYQSGTWTTLDNCGLISNNAPVANAGADIAVTAGDTVNFDGSGSSDSDGSISNYSWSNGLSGATPSQVYNDAGTYTVTLTVTDNGGKTATDTVQVTVAPQSGGITVSANTICYDNSAGYTNPTLYLWNSVPAGAIANFAWPGQAMTATGNYYCFDAGASVTSISAIFNDNGTGQTPDLTMTSPNACYKNNAWVTLQTCGFTVGEAPNVPPVANAGADITLTAGQTATFDGTGSSDADGFIASYSWDNGLSGAVDTLVYDTPGTYTVTLTVIDEDGASDSDTLTVTVQAAPSYNYPAGKALYYVNTTDFVQPTAYIWATLPAGSMADGAWPGVAMSDFGGLNVWTVDIGQDTTSGSVIFSDNGNQQTADLAFTGDNLCYNNGTWMTLTACGIPEQALTTANAGADRTVNVNSVLALSAAASTDDTSAATWTSTAWSGTLTGESVVTPTLTQTGTFTVTLTLGPDNTDSFELTVVNATNGLAQRPLLAAPLNFPLAGSVSNGNYVFERAFPDVDSLFPAPMMVTHDGINDLIYVVDKSGVLSVFPNDSAVGVADVVTLLDWSANVRNYHEQGMLSMAFDPNFASNGYAYIYYIEGDNDNESDNGVFGDGVLERITINNPFDPQSVIARVEILRVPQVGPDHKGSLMQFHPATGEFYMSFGDGGYGDTAIVPTDPDRRTNNASQETDNLLGSFIRVNMRETANAQGLYYDIPADNPFVNDPAVRDEIWSYGHRNPWRWAFDTVAPYTMWETEVGQSGYEEVNIITAGGNYGWPICEGLTHRGSDGGDPNNTRTCTGDLIGPIGGYEHDQGVSIIGGFVYRGTSLPELTGRFIYGDYVSKKIWSAGGVGDTGVLASDAFPNNIAAFGTDLSGEEVFVSAYGGEFGWTSEIYRMVDADVQAAVIPAKLSDTGIFADVANRIASSGVIEYSVNSDGWFDGLKARHFMAVPNDQTIDFPTTNPDTAQWDLPIGSVLIKHLEAPTSANTTVPFETSVLFRQNSGNWASANYRWNLAGTDADLVTTPSEQTISQYDNGSMSDVTHTVRSGAECGACHIGVGSKDPLATDTRQLNSDFDYQGVNDNQLDVFNYIGLFNNNIGSSANHGAFADPTDTGANLDQRARAYLDTNCAHCHSGSFMDMNYDTPVGDMDIMNIVRGSNFRMLPFDHTKSLLHTYQTDDANRMPKGSKLTNPVADQLIRDWINAADASQSGVRVDASQTTIESGEQVTLSVFDLYDNGFELNAGNSVSWMSSNSDVIAVSGSNSTLTVTGASAGITTLFATSGGMSSSVDITVESVGGNASALAIISAPTVNLIAGQTLPLVAIATVADEEVGVNGPTSWSSSDASVVAVSNAGLLTGGNVAGTATITASYQGLTTSIDVDNAGAGQYIYVIKPQMWNTLTTHIWTNEAGALTTRSGAWPGLVVDQSASEYGGDWLRLTIPANWLNSNNEINLIFSDNGNNQSADLTVNLAAPAWYDGQWLAAEPVGNGIVTGTQIQVGNGTVTLAGSENLSGKLFGSGTVVDINADAPGTGLEFSRWEGSGVAYLLDASSPNTQMVVGNGLSQVVLAVFDSVVDNYTVGRDYYNGQGCAGCHGSDGNGGTSLLGVPNNYSLTELISYIEGNMPLGNASACTGDCASNIAEMMMAGAYLPPENVCRADSLDDLIPQDRNYRLLSSLEYNNSIRDLLGLSGDVDVTSGNIPADIPVNGFKTNANTIFTNDYAKGYIVAAETAAGLVGNIYNLTPGCSNTSCFLADFGKRAFRQPLTTAQINTLTAVHNEQGDLALMTAILSSPAMLYRSEVGVLEGSGYYRLTDYEMASMLSYTYWATTPDAALMAKADAGQLSTPAEISATVSSMLLDSKAQAAFERFIVGWLDLDKDIKTTALSDSLKADMKQETIEFVRSVVFSGGSYSDLLNADYSYMTEQLANHYGLTWPGGTGWQQVDYSSDGTGANAERRGVLGHAGILSIQSASEKTHPVKRGLFVRQNLMCQDFPPPPIGAILKPQEDPTLTVRERFETAHLQEGCEACHQYIDGIGFGLENYNAVGQFVTTETTDDGQVKPINALGYIGSLLSAETFLSESDPVVNYEGMDELSALIADSAHGKACYARQWYRYTRGQREIATDSCTLQVFGQTFKDSSNASMLDLMVQFTQTQNYSLRK